MLCPGSVSHGLPQASRIHETFSRDDVVVLGLHSVFEHHEAQSPTSLEAFLHEYRIAFPVGVDPPGEPGGLPITMARYGMQRSEEHTSELQSLMRSSYAVFCLKKKTKTQIKTNHYSHQTR